MSIACALGFVMVITIATVLESATPAGMDEDGAAAMLVGCCMLLLAGLGVLAIGIAIGDLTRATSAKTLPILALVISGGAIGLTLLLMLLGALME
ncbi:MAG: hypothetical protein EXS10_09905 [Phycisphaerales bacterium]|nr:hypothetical protein [Phycisphaerales bacterium]